MGAGEKPGQGSLPGSPLSPPGKKPGAVDNAPSRRGLVWGLLVVVILLGLAVLFVLPEMVPDAVDQQALTTAVEEKSPAEPDSAEARKVSANQAAKALQDLLLVQARLELANAPLWGEPQWSQAAEGAELGNGLFGKRQFSAARIEFNQSRELLLELESETGQRLEKALAEGWEALESDDSDTAIRFFETAIAIDPENEEAGIGLERARLRPDVLRLMDTGGLALMQGDLQKARSAYADATGLDGLYEPAVDALKAVSGRIIDIQFDAAMSEALEAIESERVKDAEVALQRADGLKPGQQAVADGRIRLGHLKRKLWLASQRGAGAGYEAKENWQAAASVYKKVLAAEPQAGFARQGLKRAEDRSRLHRQFDHYLQDPQRVYAAEPLANAEELLASAGTAPAAEPLLAGKIQRLKALVRQAKTPVMVTLTSDGQTNVTIYQVGRLGAFTSHRMELTPGSYTVVGSRPGFRDVRKTLTVEPGAGQSGLVIRCEEAI